jgi:hypothetical protein
MSAAGQTKIFGMKLGMDPKILVVGLMALAGLLFWLNSRGDESHPSTPAASRTAESAPVEEPPAAATTRARTARDRRNLRSNDRSTLKLKTVAPGSGEVDPVLRLDLLDKLSKVEPAPEVRNLFELEATPAPAQQVAQAPKPVVPAPIVPVVPQPAPAPPQPQANIPLRYYGFAKPSRPGDVSRGFFMNGDDVLVAAEGQTLKNSFRIVQLTPQSAIVEDTRVHLSQTLPVTPEALDQGGSNAFNHQNGMMQQNGFPNQNEGNEP